MEQSGVNQSKLPADATNFLVIRRGSARRSVIPLSPGEILTIGRANSNRVVIPDAKCSRQHCEVFSSGGRWLVRDLGSRNGVLVDGERIDGEVALKHGDLLTIGACEAEFTNTAPEGSIYVGGSIDVGQGATFDIIERKSGTRYDKPPATDTSTRTKPGLNELYLLARSMAEAASTVSLAERALEGIFASSSASLGAVLLVTSEGEKVGADDLEYVATMSRKAGETPSASRYLSEIVLEDHEALLARDLSKNESLALRDSLSLISADSAICAPIRHQGRVLGLIHLYAVKEGRSLETDDLEFALAVADQFGVALENVKRREALQQGLSKAELLANDLRQQLEVETELVGNSSQMNDLRSKVGRIAPTDATVLIRGESGVGKELVARAVHFNSHRRDQAFVCVNCAALSESLLESELFGHEKGSFTGAVGQKVGKFEQADRGTLFLDEVGEMSPEVQSKFLRVLEGHPYERVGGSKPIQVDVRVVTATNRNLEAAVKEGKFRQDLYFRLQVLELFVPPLRKHPDDIPVISSHFLERTAARSRIKCTGFTNEAVEVLREYHWPGNVRELKNVIERSAILSDNELLTADDIRLQNFERPTPLADHQLFAGLDDRVEQMPSKPLAPSSDDTQGIWKKVINQELSLDQLENQYITATLDRLGWNKSAAARQLGIERTTLDRKLKKYGITKPD
ncbi:MAG: sigma 54-interacting transcriptional regulator [Planctomycetaceae bacterium]|nr:sigma 54-interacting transcriptional regulator [Planctomycetaceae bacterium]